MRFEFCGNVSCPEWFIAQISVLTKITAIKMKLIFTQIISSYMDGEDISSKIVKLLTGTGLDIYEMNAVASTLTFILHNSVQFHISDSTLNKQLIDLGLPKQNVQSITKTYKGSREKLLERSLQKMPKLTSGVDIQYSIHQILGSYKLGSLTGGTQNKFVEINLNYRNSRGKEHGQSFLMTEDDLENMIYELEEAIDIIEKLESVK